MPPEEQSIRSTPRAREFARQDEAVLDRPAIGAVVEVLAPVDAGEAEEQRLAVRPDSRARCGDLEREPHAALQVAAIFVVALVGDGREEGVDQVAMRGVDIEHIEAGRQRPAARSRHTPPPVVLISSTDHRPRLVPAGDAVGIGLNCTRLPRRLALRGLRLAERTQSFPWALPRRFRAGVVELRCRHGALLRAGNRRCGAAARRAGRTRCRGRHRCCGRSDRRSAPSVMTVPAPPTAYFARCWKCQSVAKPSGADLVHLHRGDHDPVREGDAAQPKRAEQQRLDHRNTHSCLMEKPPARTTRPPPRRACPRPAGFAAGPRSGRRSSRRRGRHRRHHHRAARSGP